MEIYKITNLVNGKCYIGQTITTFNKRYNFAGKGIERVLAYLEMREAKSNAYSKKLYYNDHLLKAIRKYGTNNFTVEIIDKAQDIDELNEKEMYWIKYYKAYKKGYNQCKGGNGNHGYIPSEETRKIWSRQRKGMHAGEKNPNYGGRLITKDVRRKMSKARKGKYMGKDSPVARKVINLDTLEVFDTLTQACQKYNISDGNLTAVCQRKKRGKHGVRKQAGGYRWMYYDEYLEKGDIVKDTRNDHYKRVINVDTGKIFDSAAEASLYYSIDSSGIIKACRGKQKTCGGYKWEYYNKE